MRSPSACARPRTKHKPSRSQPLASMVQRQSLSRTPLDALPDLSDVQVIIRTSLPGQAPQIVENQVTYPLTTTMLSVPGAKTVRGYSYFGDSFSA